MSDPRSAGQLEEALKAAGFSVGIAPGAKHVLDAVRHCAPDLLLIDDVPSTMGGIEPVLEARHSGALAGVPMVFLTARENDEQVQTVLSSAGECLAKPVAESVLVATLKRLVTRSSRWGQLWRGTGGRYRRVVNVELPRFKRFLHEKGDITAQGGAAIQQATAKTLYPLAEALGVSQERMARWLAEYLSLQYMEFVQAEFVKFDALPDSYCRENSVLVLEKAGVQALVVSNPFDWEVLNGLADTRRIEGAFQTYVTEPAKIARVLSRGADGRPQGADEGILTIIDQLRDRKLAEDTADQGNQSKADDAGPIVILVNKLIEQAYSMGSSDIHIEPFEDEVVIRYRVDGNLSIMHRLRPASLIRQIVSRIKVMSGLDISERRLPQDGRISFKSFSHLNTDFDLRVSMAPMNHGEKVVLRILDKQKSVLPLDSLGFSERHLGLYREAIRSPYGMILHVGPTGSGKSMTVYAAINELKCPQINIQTIEDPIEYTTPGISQLQVHSDIGLTFARALRCFLRQDPDVILVGEIRDLETASIAVEAALTGHLLVSTLHTNDACSTVTRLLQMGIPAHMVSSSLVVVCAQRLLRRLCSHCKEPYAADSCQRQLLGVPPHVELTLYRARGCQQCMGIGYKGRVGIHELLIPDDMLRMEVNKSGVTAEGLKRNAVERCGMTTLYWDALEKARSGVTSVEEVLTEVRPDDFPSRPAWMSHERGEACHAVPVGSSPQALAASLQAVESLR